MGTIRVGVLRGGPSDEHKISFKTGKSVLENLPYEYSGKDIFISKNGEWNFEGKPSNPERVFRSVDIIFNALHGNFGEDGKVQRLLETFNIPYTGSRVISSAFGMNKILARDAFAKAGLNIPRVFIVDINDNPAETARAIFQSMHPFWVVKPASSGSSIGVSVVKSFSELVNAIKNAFCHSQKVIVEEYIKGREVSCGVIDNFRNQKYYSLPVVEITARGKVCLANFNLEIKKEIERLAREAHCALDCRHYSHSGFIITPKNKIYILETDTLPELSEESLWNNALESVGSSSKEFLGHILKSALG